jgi:hypothetical protein
MKPRSAIIALSLTILAGCAPTSAGKGGFHADDPGSKLQAIMRAGSTQDRSALHNLVEQLDSDDPVVRMMTIIALQQITGDRMGYNPYASVVERQPAIDRWAQVARQERYDNQAATP